MACDPLNIMCSNRWEIPVMPGRSFTEPTWATQPPATVGERWRGTSSSFMPFERKCSWTLSPAAGGGADPLAAALDAARAPPDPRARARAADTAATPREAWRLGVDMAGTPVVGSCRQVGAGGRRRWHETGMRGPRSRPLVRLEPGMCLGDGRAVGQSLAGLVPRG